MRFDFALGLLCGGRAALAQREYERAVQDLAALDPLRARGLLVVARHDLAQASAHTELPDEDTERIRALLARALEACERESASVLATPVG